MDATTKNIHIGLRQQFIQQEQLTIATILFANDH